MKTGGTTLILTINNIFNIKRYIEYYDWFSFSGLPVHGISINLLRWAQNLTHHRLEFAEYFRRILWSLLITRILVPTIMPVARFLAAKFRLLLFEQTLAQYYAKSFLTRSTDKSAYLSQFTKTSLVPYCHSLETEYCSLTSASFLQ